MSDAEHMSRKELLQPKPDGKTIIFIRRSCIQEKEFVHERGYCSWLF
jgi:hypothetical protein